MQKTPKSSKSSKSQKPQNSNSTKLIIETKYKYLDGSTRRIINHQDGTFTVIDKGAKK